MGSFSKNEILSGLNMSLFEDSKIPPGATRFLNLQSQVPDPPVASKFPAGLSRLRDLYYGLSQLKDVTDAHVLFQHPLRGEIFSKATHGKTY